MDVTTDDDHRCDKCGAVCGEHSYTADVTAPTCEEKGYTTHTCNCGDSYRDSETAAIGHQWDSGVVTKEATTESAGEKTYTCSVCQSTKTESIPKLPAPGGSSNVIYSGDTAVGGGWQLAVQVYATAWDGPLDGGIFAEDGHIALRLTATTTDIWSAHVVLQGTDESWNQIDKDVAAFTVNADGSYTVSFTYDELVKAYGSSDFSNLGCFYVYVNSAAGTSVTVTSVEYVSAEDEETPKPSEPSEPNEPIEPSEPSEPIEPSKPSEPEEPTQDTKPEQNNPQTGDSFCFAAALGMLMLCGACAVLLLPELRRRRQWK